MAELDGLRCSKVKLVMDRGFYSEDNINALFMEHVKFIIAGRMSLSFIQQVRALLLNDAYGVE